MGAEFQAQVIEAKNSSEVKAAFERLVRECKHVNGHGGYTGTFAEAPGLSIHATKVFNTYEDAEEYLDKTARKWENAIAVPYYSTQDDKFQAKRKEFEAKPKYLKLHVKASKAVEALKAAQAKLDQTEKSEVDKFNKAKAKHVTCPNCQSKIARQYLKNMHCPVCTPNEIYNQNKTERTKQARLMPESTRKRLLKALDQVAKAEAKSNSARADLIKALEEFKTAYFDKLKDKPIDWLVGGVFSC